MIVHVWWCKCSLLQGRILSETLKVRTDGNHAESFSCIFMNIVVIILLWDKNKEYGLFCLI